MLLIIAVLYLVVVARSYINIRKKRSTLCSHRKTQNKLGGCHLATIGLIY